MSWNFDFGKYLTKSNVGSFSFHIFRKISKYFNISSWGLPKHIKLKCWPLPMVCREVLGCPHQISENTRSLKECFNVWTKLLFPQKLTKLVNMVNKKSTVNTSFGNVLLTCYKWWKLFKSNTKPNFKYCISFSIQGPNIQPGVFLDKMKGHVWCTYHLLTSHLMSRIHMGR